MLPLPARLSDQILFTYFMAFIISDDPFNTDNSAIAAVLLVANFAVFGFAYKRAYRELEARWELQGLHAKTIELATELQDFQKSLVNVVAVARPMDKDREKFLPGGAWCASASKADLLAAAKNIELDIVGVEEKEDELRRYVEVAAQQIQSGTKALWYWREDDARISGHAAAEIYDNKWIK